MARNIVLYALTLALLAVGYLAHSTSKELYHAVETIETLQGQVASKQAENNLLAQAVTVSSDALDGIKRDRALVVQLHQQQLASQQKTQQELQTALNAIEQLKVNGDDYAKNWVVAAYPDAACRLLRWAECSAGGNQNGSATGTSLSDSAREPDGRLHTAARYSL